MAAKKGHEKLGGRQKGGKNKNTLLLDTFAKTIIEGGMGRFQDELNKLSGKDYINAYMTLFEYVKPKLARGEHTIDQNQVFKVGYGDEDTIDYSKLTIKERTLILDLIEKAKQPKTIVQFINPHKPDTETT